MDADHFDCLARALSQGLTHRPSRRSLTQVLGGLVFGPLALLGVAETEAGKKGKKKRRRKRKKDTTPSSPPPPAGILSSPPAPGCTPNCNQRICGDNGCGGSCGTCGTGQVCANGRCVSSCPSGQKVCNGECIASGLCCTNAECPADRPICYNGSCDPCVPIYYFGAVQNCESSQQCCGTVSGVPAVCCQIGDTGGPVCQDFLSNTTACAPRNECPAQGLPQGLENCLNYQPDRTCVNGVCVEG